MANKPILPREFYKPREIESEPDWRKQYANIHFRIHYVKESFRVTHGFEPTNLYIGKKQLREMKAWCRLFRKKEAEVLPNIAGMKTHFTEKENYIKVTA